MPFGRQGPLLGEGARAAEAAEVCYGCGLHDGGSAGTPEKSCSLEFGQKRVLWCGWLAKRIINVFSHEMMLGYESSACQQESRILRVDSTTSIDGRHGREWKQAI